MAQAYKTQTEQVSAQFINANFVRKLEAGHVKEAQDEGGAFIRQKVREESFARKIIEPVMLADDQIDRDENTDQPKKIVEKEPDSVATFVPFNGTAPRTWFKGKRFSVYFGKTESNRFTKNKFELMTYQNDIRKILSDNSVKDMSDQEDQKFLNTINDILAIAIATQVTSGVSFGSGIFKQGFQALQRRKQAVGKILMTKALYYEAIDLPATVIGNDVASSHYKDGIEDEERLFGHQVITTNKDQIVDDATGNRRSAYIFSPQEYLGVFYLLQDATLYIKQEADIIEFWSYAALGIGIGNTQAVQRLDLPA